MSYIFGGNTGLTYADIQRQRELADALAIRKKRPQTFGEGLSAIGEAFLARRMRNKADEGMEKKKGEMQSVFRSILGGQTPGTSRPSGTSQPKSTSLPRDMGSNTVPGYRGDTVTSGNKTYDMGRASSSVGSKDEISQYIREAAAARGIDPDVAVRVAASEGLHADPKEAWQSNYVKNGKRERSYGPFQLYIDGGLGNQFMSDTGLDPRDASTWRQQVDYSLDHAAKNGWGAWYGADRVGIGDMDGIGVRTASLDGGQQMAQVANQGQQNQRVAQAYSFPETQQQPGQLNMPFTPSRQMEPGLGQQSQQRATPQQTQQSVNQAMQRVLQIQGLMETPGYEELTSPQQRAQAQQALMQAQTELETAKRQADPTYQLEIQQKQLQVRKLQQELEAQPERKTSKDRNGVLRYEDTREPVYPDVQDDGSDPKWAYREGIGYVDENNPPDSLRYSADNPPGGDDPDVEGESKLRKEFMGLAPVKAFQEQAQAFGRITASAQDPSPAGDLAMVFNFMKVLDPGSVVRESEFATAESAAKWMQESEEAGMIIPRPVASAIRKIATGQRLSPEQRQDFVDRGAAIYRQSESQFNTLAGQYDNIAQDYGYEVGRTIPDARYRPQGQLPSQEFSPRPQARPGSEALRESPPPVQGEQSSRASDFSSMSAHEIVDMDITTLSPEEKRAWVQRMDELGL